MSTTFAPFTPTAQHVARFEEWLDGYVATVREMWVEQGVDVESENARKALALVRLSMTVPERAEWVNPTVALGARASATFFPPVDEDGLLNFRDALRTYNALSRAERIAAIADQLGVDAATVERMLDGDAGEMDVDDIAGETALYRHYDALGSLLYVGISTDPNVRSRQHADKSPWHVLSARMDVEWHPTRTAARAAERAAISDEEPLFNISNATEKAKQRAIDYLLAHVAGSLA